MQLMCTIIYIFPISSLCLPYTVYSLLGADDWSRVEIRIIPQCKFKTYKVLSCVWFKQAIAVMTVSFHWAGLADHSFFKTGQCLCVIWTIEHL